MYFGLSPEAFFETVSGLTQDTEYAVCLVAEDKEGKTASPAVTFTTAIPPETPAGLRAEGVTTTTATLTGVLNPGAVGDKGTYEFLYRASASECEVYNPIYHRVEVVNATPAEGSLGGAGEAAKAAVAGLLPNTTYTFCLRAYNEVGEESTLSAPVTFETLAAPLKIEAESSSGLAATEARLEATINPGNSETAYHFEYGPAAGSYDVSLPIPAGSIHAGLSGIPVSVAATGLRPATTYHWRVVASNALPGEVDGPDQEFTTPAAQPTGSPQNCPNEQRRAEQRYALSLPDCRAYEMVSPLETNGQDATDSFVSSEPRASVSGEAITYGSKGSFADPTGAALESQFLSRRGALGWSTQNITPPQEPLITEGLEPSYGSNEFFSPELTEGIAITDARLTSEAPSHVESGEFFGYLADFANGSYQYMSREVPTDLDIGVSADFSHVVIGESEFVDGKLVPVMVSNKDEDIGGGLGSPGGIQTFDRWHAVSAEVYFESGPVLYVRENAEMKQSELNAKGECTEPERACTVVIASGSPRYWGASADGAKAFYTEGGDLYQYEVSSGRTTTLTKGGKVLGVAQISEDGSYVYFVAEGALAAGASEQQCRAETEAERTGVEPKQDNLGCNLYVSHGGGAPTLIATLAANDISDWKIGPAANSAVVTPDGTRLAFLSERSLTGYDNDQAEPGECERRLGIFENGEEYYEADRCREVYLYDAETSSLVCASCNPSGARPAGPSSLDPTLNIHYLARNLAEDGTLFFDSSDALVPHASDGRENVYEYEHGHVYPISDVAGGYESFFIDASVSGNDVFIGTADQLLAQDTSNNVVVYDARVGGGFPVTVSPPSCDNGDSCKPPPAPQPGVFGAPASATFSGAGNPPPPPAVLKTVTKKVVACPKGKKRSKHGKCVKRQKSKKTKAKRAGDNGRTGR
jgi:hypothetical protein